MPGAPRRLPCARLARPQRMWRSWGACGVSTAYLLFFFRTPCKRSSIAGQWNRGITWYISDLRISSVFLKWNLRSCAPMFAVSVLYAIPGFEQLKTQLRVKVCAVLRCFMYFLRSLRSPYADNARNVRGISVIVCENVAAIAFVDDFPLMISRHMTHVSRLLHLSITENHWKKYIGVCISNRIRKQAHVILVKYWWTTDNSRTIGVI